MEEEAGAAEKQKAESTSFLGAIRGGVGAAAPGPASEASEEPEVEDETMRMVGSVPAREGRSGRATPGSM